MATTDSMCLAHRNLKQSTWSQWKANLLRKFPLDRDTRHIWKVWELKLMRSCHCRDLLSCPNTQYKNFQKSKWIAEKKKTIEQLPNCEWTSPPSNLAFWLFLKGFSGPQNHRCLSLWCTWRSSWVRLLFLSCSFSSLFFCTTLMTGNSECRSNTFHSQKTFSYKNNDDYIHNWVPWNV